MDAYREAIDNKKRQNETADTDQDDLPVSTETIQLPSDQDISKTLRAYRDRHGTRQKPIGIVRALQHLLQDLGVPTSEFGEYTYTTLMTCCQTPQEGRRIFKLMRAQNHEISSYSWSILVDVSIIHSPIVFGCFLFRIPLHSIQAVVVFKILYAMSLIQTTKLTHW